MIISAPSDIAFVVLGVPIYWYGVVLASAIFVAVLVGNKFFNFINGDSKKDIILEYAPLLIISGIFGARLYFCILNSGYYFSHPIEILDIRQGGLSIHGAIAGGILSLVLLSYKKNLKLLNILDSLSCSTILGQAIGRWGNYFNSEAYGIPVASQKWGLFIPEMKRIPQYSEFSLFHPTFLYESVLDLFAFFILGFLLFKFGKKYRGLIFFSYLLIYSIIRFFIERLRVDSAMNLGNIPIAEIVSIILFVVGFCGILFVIVNNLKIHIEK
ncbi:prolipoprotein diacylglyceryl transferase [bacterium]|nr:prolipoprotein diacylglyceryl transferase [bacterium]